MSDVFAISRGQVVSQFAEMFQTCHAERRASPGDSRDQRKSKHLENLSFAMQLQGVLFYAFLP